MNKVAAHLAAAASLAALLAPNSTRAQPLSDDVRDFRVGMAVSALPPQGYAEFRCVAGEQKLAGWADYLKCPVDADGRYEVGFRYDDDGEHQTKIAGQPVLLSLLLGKDGTVDAIRVRTDPSARLFLRKRGYIFGEQVMARYGEVGWACTEGRPSAGQEPIGGSFMREHCEKTVGIRHLTVDRELYQLGDKNIASFVSATTFLISLVKVNQG